MISNLFSFFNSKWENSKKQNIPKEDEKNDEKNENMIHEEEKDIDHIFELMSFTIPTFCNYCKEFIWGFYNQGYTCVVCKYTIHDRCYANAPKNCRPSINDYIKNIDLTNFSNLSFEKFFPHHFIEGNLPIGAECNVCQESFELFGFNGLRCSRCEIMVHEKCKNLIISVACLPKYLNLLYIDKFLLNMFKERFSENTPLIVFINSKSGGQYGGQLIYDFTRFLDRSQVFDMNADKNGPEKGLNEFKDVENLRILVCGGDGTVGWVLSYIDKLNFINFPPVAILPLGTGNDLARTLGWGNGYSGEDISFILDRIQISNIVSLDRWEISFIPGKTNIMNNYMSIGVDAEVALEFHKLRNSNPELFTSQFINKFWYAQYGMKSLFSDIDELANMIDLEVDGNKIELPDGLGGIMILNLPNYAGGADLWGQPNNNDQYKPQNINDRILEIVAITGSFHMGTIQVNLSHAIRVAQGYSINIKVYQQLPVQIDGEPWLQEPCSIKVRFWNQARMLQLYNHKFMNKIDNAKDIEYYQKENKLLKEENYNLKIYIENLEKKLKKEKEKKIELRNKLSKFEKK